MVATGAPSEADVSGRTDRRLPRPARRGRSEVVRISFYVLVTRLPTAGEGACVPRVADDPKWTDPGLLVMGSLAGGPKHGYAMVRDVEETTGVRLGPGHVVRGDRPTRGPGPDRGARRAMTPPSPVPVDRAGRRGPRTPARRHAAVRRRGPAAPGAAHPDPGGCVDERRTTACTASSWLPIPRASATATARSSARSSSRGLRLARHRRSRPGRRPGLGGAGTSAGHAVEQRRSRLQTTTITVLAAWCASMLAAAGFSKAVDDPPCPACTDRLAAPTTPGPSRWRRPPRPCSPPASSSGSSSSSRPCAPDAGTSCVPALAPALCVSAVARRHRPRGTLRPSHRAPAPAVSLTWPTGRRRSSPCCVGVGGRHRWCASRCCTAGAALALRRAEIAGAPSSRSRTAVACSGHLRRSHARPPPRWRCLGRPARATRRPRPARRRVQRRFRRPCSWLSALIASVSVVRGLRGAASRPTGIERHLRPERPAVPAPSHRAPSTAATVARPWSTAPDGPALSLASPRCRGRWRGGCWRKASAPAGAWPGFRPRCSSASSTSSCSGRKPDPAGVASYLPGLRGRLDVAVAARRVDLRLERVVDRGALHPARPGAALQPEPVRPVAAQGAVASSTSEAPRSGPTRAPWSSWAIRTPSTSSSSSTSPPTTATRCTERACRRDVTHTELGPVRYQLPLDVGPDPVRRRFVRPRLLGQSIEHVPVDEADTRPGRGGQDPAPRRLPRPRHPQRPGVPGPAAGVHRPRPRPRVHPRGDDRQARAARGSRSSRRRASTSRRARWPRRRSPSRRWPPHRGLFAEIEDCYLLSYLCRSTPAWPGRVESVSA